MSRLTLAFPLAGVSAARDFPSLKVARAGAFARLGPAQAHLAFEARFVMEGDLTSDRGYTTIKRLLSIPDPPRTHPVSFFNLLCSPAP